MKPEKKQLSVLIMWLDRYQHLQETKGAGGVTGLTSTDM